MNHELKKKALIELANELTTDISKILHDSPQQKLIVQLLADIEEDFYTVVVLGEFNRGKSTFINAILGEDLLPMGITPTTATINAIMWGEERQLEIKMKDRRTFKYELKTRLLQEYTAKDDFNSADIDYIKITMPLDFLKNRIVLVDTPGVDDINKQRMEITYNFVPRADLVIFLLDSTSPVRKTEQEFIQNVLYKEGLKRIIFIANFIDELDEPERDCAADTVARRLNAALDDERTIVLPLSSRQALDARLCDDNTLLDESGMSAIEKHITDTIYEGSQGDAKAFRFIFRLNTIIDAIERETSLVLNLYMSDSQILEKQLAVLKEQLDDGQAIKKSIVRYVQEREREMNAIINKSVQYFGENLKENVMSKIDHYNAQSFKAYVENALINESKSSFYSWLTQYVPSINIMLKMLEKELAMGLANEFNAEVSSLKIVKTDLAVELGAFSISAEDISNTNITAGLLAGGAGAVAMMLGAPILLPILGMAGYPFLQKTILDRKLSEAKTLVKPELNRMLDDSIYNMKESLNNYVLSNTENITEAVLHRFTELITIMRDRVTANISEREAEGENINSRIESIKELQNTLDIQRKKLAELG